MRAGFAVALAALALLSGLAALAAVAAADTAFQQGPVSAATANSGTGDCASTGYATRTAGAEVAVDQANRFGAWVSNGCSAWTNEDWSEQHRWLSVMAGRCGDWGCGPYAALWWNGDAWAYGSETWQSCASGFYASGPTVFLGCPSLDGSGPPLLPELP